MESHIEKGLSSEEATRRLKEVGFNELKEKPGPSFFQRVKQQFDNFLVRILLAAALVSIFLGEWVDAGAIIGIVLLNTLIGVFQEVKADRALQMLKKMGAPVARVIRDSQEKLVPGRELVPGDLVVLETGNHVPADVRLVESINLKIDESALTGESVPVAKEANIVLDREIPLGDRLNSAFMGTLVTYGRGLGLVVATGNHTQMGLIAEMIQSTQEELTPLQRKLDGLGKWLGKFTLGICVFIFIFGLLRETSVAQLFQTGLVEYVKDYREEIVLLFMTAVSLAIAAVPEGLPAVVTICLATGMQRMVKKNALIRKLPAVETLGCTTVICSDKTGTLTQNQMTVVAGWVDKGQFSVTGRGYLSEGEFLFGEKRFEATKEPLVRFLLTAAVACSDARLEPSGEDSGKKTYRVLGDPTEGAIIVCALKARMAQEEINQHWPRVAEIPFDSKRKRMSTVHLITEEGKSDLPWEIQAESKYLVYVKGAPEELMKVCSGFCGETGWQPITPEKKRDILTANQAMASQALRVLGVCFRLWAGKPKELGESEVEKDLVFIGLLGMIDPARQEVSQAIEEAKQAGVRTVMITGDYQETAKAIAEQIGLKRPEGLILDGRKLDSLSLGSLAQLVDKVDVFARVSPQHKTMIVEALREKKEVVAMTGDGVNDAPALKMADIGVAMGIAGTDVAKETADLILTDDNYATIVAAVEEGRIIYSNIRKFVFYLVSCNVGEILIIFAAMVLGWPLPLKPVHLLWLNLVTDGAPALALGMEKGEPGIMKQKPRSPSEPVINREMIKGVLIQAAVMALAMLTVFSWSLKTYGEIARAQTTLFATLILSELWRAYTARSERWSVFRMGLWTNRWMQYSVGSSLVMLLVVLEIPFLQRIFGTVPLSWKEWQMILPFSFFSAITAELTKMFSSLKPKEKSQTTLV
ncbi:MAG: cation-translocating P-type ATPase [Candidatus Omnitrophica bacterium]|nr:cation-translocating P-type ATPase [Candidatus Omnitrophota bacterium]